jgi:hypothetical protein
MRGTKIAIALALGFGVLALVGVGNASATVLCKENAVPCPAAKTYPVGTEIAVKLKPMKVWKLKIGAATIECGESKIEAKTFNVGKVGERVGATITKNEFGLCNVGQFAGAVKLGTLEIEFAGGGNGTVTLANNNEIETEAGAVECSYGETSAGKSLGLTGALLAPSLTATEATTTLVKTAGGFICANPAKMIAEYEVTKPIPLFAVEK